MLVGLTLVAAVTAVGLLICAWRLWVLDRDIAILDSGLTHLHDQWRQERQAASTTSQRLQALEATTVTVERQMQAMEPWVRMWARREKDASR